MTLGGTLIVHNAIERDYCVLEALESLCGVCDHVVVLDARSTDGTVDLLKDYYNTNPKCLYTPILNAPWAPNGGGAWLADLTNEAREMLRTDMHLNLQADEVLSDSDYPLIRQLANTGGIYTFNRFNFWHDAQHMLPPEEKVGSCIIRLGPTWLPSVGDAQGLDPTHGCQQSDVRVWHYGFLRRAKGFVAKSRDMMSQWGYGLDPVLEGVEKQGMGALCDPAYATAVPLGRLVAYHGEHPRVAHEWLKERGYRL